MTIFLFATWLGFCYNLLFKKKSRFKQIFYNVNYQKYSVRIVLQAKVTIERRLLELEGVPMSTVDRRLLVLKGASMSTKDRRLLVLKGSLVNCNFLP